MFNRRRFLQATAAVPLGVALPRLSLAQSNSEHPDFEIAGTAQTDPPGWEITWNNEWEQRDISNMTFQPEPGVLGFVVLDAIARQEGFANTKQRVVLRTDAVTGVVNPMQFLAEILDEFPETNMGFAPGTMITKRVVTDTGCWFSFSADEDAAVPGVVGVSLYYMPPNEGDPVLNAFLNFQQGDTRTPEWLEQVDSSIAINGNWLFGMDDLSNFWEAMKNSAGFEL